MTACEGILYHKETFPTYNAAYYIQIDSNAMAKTVMDIINSWNGTESETNSEVAVFSFHSYRNA